MDTRALFAVALPYLVIQWLLSFVRKQRLQVITHADGELDGPLVHRYVKVEKTLSGKPSDVTFHYVESPARGHECVVFLHGFMDTWRLWRHQLAHFAGRYRLVAFDLKGSGQSSMNYPQRLFPEVRDPGGDYALEMQAEELVTALDKVGVQRFNLVTLDLGTIIGDILAGQYPERVLRYVTLSAAPGWTLQVIDTTGAHLTESKRRQAPYRHIGGSARCSAEDPLWAHGMARA